MPASKIWYIEAMAHQCVLYTEDTSHVLCSSIGEMVRQLCSRKEFVRCHRSFLVNKDNIREIDFQNRVIYMVNGDECLLSSRMMKGLK